MDKMDKIAEIRTEIHEAEERLLVELRKTRGEVRISDSDILPQYRLTFGQRIADTVAAGMGSWRFIIIQSLILFVWIVLNLTAYAERWDPYPFILLNLVLSFQAAYAAPVIMMSQNRQQDIDRRAAEEDHRINIKAELEIELLHQKLDHLRETEVLYLTETVKELTRMLARARIEPEPEPEAAFAGD
ncbi:MAG: DUF1003 domain-containing protein [Ancalomicrobiaceae bacterium]|nr:DUF1003 domain-containing protein [Ancalomicrobiaceae bacterium]